MATLAVCPVVSYDLKNPPARDATQETDWDISAWPFEKGYYYRDVDGVISGYIREVIVVLVDTDTYVAYILLSPTPGDGPGA